MTLLQNNEMSVGQTTAELEQRLQAALAERDELLQQQAASAEILKVINSSPGDLAPVFDIILEKAHGLCDVPCGSLQLLEGDQIRAVAVRGMTDAFEKFLRQGYRITNLVQRVQSDRPFQIDDLADALDRMPDDLPVRAAVELGGIRTMLSVALVRDGVVFGRIVAGRKEVRPFTDKQIALLQGFADQAVIAIQNARLFKETRQALERQTATADILKVIASSPSDVQPVFEAVAERAMSLLDCWSVSVLRFDGEQMHLAAARGALPDSEQYLRTLYPARPDPETNQGRCILERATINVADIQSDPNPRNRERARARGFRAGLVVPMLRDRRPIGVISASRKEAGAFAANEVELLQTFADQAVIAIENVRLFNETRESLERQTATAEVLQVISNSISDATPVFERILESTGRLIDCRNAAILLTTGDERLDCAAVRGPDSDAIAAVYPMPLAQTSAPVVIALRRQVCYPDVANGPEVPTSLRESVAARGNYSIAITPLLWEGNAIGMLSASRDAGVTFNEKELGLLRTFADQAVIAIQNARLFNETKEALERQTATADILKVIASSPDDVQPVFQAIAERSNRLVNGLSTTVLSIVGQMIHLSAFTLTNPAADAALTASFPRQLSAQAWSQHNLRGEIYCVPDTEDEPSVRDLARLRGYRSMLFVPLLHDGAPIGMIGQTRVEPGPFPAQHVQLLKTFADQAVIAISNVRLFQQVQARTRELSASLDDLRAAQDRLVQTEKLASLGQLTAGIAHEIKNPLNFVNNFSALSAELIDELDEALAPVTLDKKTRSDIGELTQMLKGNLEKVVQHGRRADSIVKNMLLHSREGSGEHRSADINAIVDESLNLAYHGARAERSGFHIVLRRELDPDAGMVELYPQEITRVLLNLISNGFYAANKRKESGDETFEPMVSATTKSLGNTVEIRIRDNGAGIPLEVKEKMFNPFFTTKPAGEGTGLGLSMSHDIVVKQHGGKIDVDTEPGVFTEFIVTLPRTAVAQTHSGGTN